MANEDDFMPDIDLAMIQNPDKADDKLFVEFLMEPIQSTEKSQAEGRPIFEDVLHIKIRVGRDTIFRPVTEKDKTRFQRQYFLFRRNRPQVIGTPLTEWPFLSRTRVMELQAIGMQTVEMVADMPDSSIHRLGTGARDLQNRAKVFIETAKGNAPTERLNTELAKRDAEIEALKSQLLEITKAKSQRRKPTDQDEEAA